MTLKEYSEATGIDYPMVYSLTRAIRPISRAKNGAEYDPDKISFAVIEGGKRRYQEKQRQLDLLGTALTKAKAWEAETHLQKGSPNG